MKTQRRIKLRPNKTRKTYLGGNEKIKASKFNKNFYYVGNIIDNKPHDDNGVIVETNGNTVYFGSIKNGKKNGKAALIKIDEKVIATSDRDWDNVNSSSSIMYFDYEHNKIDIEPEIGDNTVKDAIKYNSYYYSGDMNNDLPNGFGVSVFFEPIKIQNSKKKNIIDVNKGDIYVGTFEDGQMHGKGILYDLTNKIVRGIECDNGILNDEKGFDLDIRSGEVEYYNATTDIIDVPAAHKQDTTDRIPKKPSPPPSSSSRKTQRNILSKDKQPVNTPPPRKSNITHKRQLTPYKLSSNIPPRNTSPKVKQHVNTPMLLTIQHNNETGNYIGNINKDAKPHDPNGVFLSTNGNVFVGKFFKGKPKSGYYINGTVVTYTDNTQTYNINRNQINENPIFVGNIDIDIKYIHLNDWNKYTYYGKLDNNLPHGPGIAQFHNYTYVGNFDYGRANGVGTLIDHNPPMTVYRIHCDNGKVDPNDGFKFSSKSEKFEFFNTKQSSPVEATIQQENANVLSGTRSKTMSVPIQKELGNKQLSPIKSKAMPWKKGYYVGNIINGSPHDINGVILFKNNAQMDHLFVGNITDGKIIQGTYIDQIPRVGKIYINTNTNTRNTHTVDYLFKYKKRGADSDYEDAIIPMNQPYYYSGELKSYKVKVSGTGQKTNTDLPNGFGVSVFFESIKIQNSKKNNIIDVNKGDIYVGTFEDGQMHGKGILYDLTNKIVRGIECANGILNDEKGFALDIRSGVVEYYDVPAAHKQDTTGIIDVPAEPKTNSPKPQNTKTQALNPPPTQPTRPTQPNTTVSSQPTRPTQPKTTISSQPTRPTQPHRHVLPPQNNTFTLDNERTYHFPLVGSGEPVMLGEGTYGKVIKCTNGTCNTYAIKYDYYTNNNMDVYNSTITEETYNKRLNTELKILKKLLNDGGKCNEYILCPMDWGIYHSDYLNSKYNNRFVIVYEYLDNYSSMHNIIKSTAQPHNPKPEQYQSMIYSLSKDNDTIITNLLKGLFYMHKKGIYHNDIKPGNIMINLTTNQIKYIDFGLSVFGGCEHMMGTFLYVIHQSFYFAKYINILDCNRHKQNNDLISCLLTIHCYYLNPYIHMYINHASEITNSHKIIYAFKAMLFLFIRNLIKDTFNMKVYIIKDILSDVTNAVVGVKEFNKTHNVDVLKEWVNQYYNTLNKEGNWYVKFTLEPL